MTRAPRDGIGIGEAATYAAAAPILRSDLLFQNQLASPLPCRRPRDTCCGPGSPASSNSPTPSQLSSVRIRTHFSIAGHDAGVYISVSVTRCLRASSGPSTRSADNASPRGEILAPPARATPSRLRRRGYISQRNTEPKCWQIPRATQRRPASGLYQSLALGQRRVRWPRWRLRASNPRASAPRRF